MDDCLYNDRYEKCQLVSNNKVQMTAPSTDKIFCRKGNDDAELWLSDKTSSMLTWYNPFMNNPFNAQYLCRHHDDYP